MISDLYYILLDFELKEPQVLFGNPTTVEEVNKAYKKLALMFHPDKHQANAEDAKYSYSIFNLISRYKESLILSFNNKDSGFEVSIVLDKKDIKFSQVIHKGDLGIVLGNGIDTIKVLREINYGILYKNAEANLNKIRGIEHFDKYLPGKITPLKIKLNGNVHPAHHYKYINGYTLEEVKAKHGFIDPRHSTWMLNRILELLSHSHSKGIANLGILPRHIIINPNTHGAVVLDWTCSTAGKPIAVADTTSFGKYPDFIFDKPDDVRYADVMMAFDIFGWLSEDIPNEISNFKKAIDDGYYKITDTIDIYKRFRKVIDSIWKKEFLTFNM